MWKIRSPGTLGDRLWQYVTDLRRGDDHDPEEELRSLMPVARLVSEALIGGGQGPEVRSEARLIVAIARSEMEGVKHRRRWTLPAFAVTGWCAATIGLVMFAYQFGVSDGYVRGQIATRAERTPASFVAAAPTEPEPAIDATARKHVHRYRTTKTRPAAKTARSSEEPAPPVRVDEILPSDDATASGGEPDSSIASDSQDNLFREGNTLLAQGKWEKAISTLQQAASENPDDETAMDALHLAGTIAERALNDPKRATVMYRKEIDLGKKLLAQKDAKPVPVKQRLARVMTDMGLRERNPRLIQQAVNETQTSPEPTASTPSAGIPD